jgi:DNA-binding NarL/FixJ family response regulator
MESTNNEDRPWEPTSDGPSVRSPLISVGLVDEHAFTRECITRSLKELDHGLDTVSFKTYEECLRSTRELDMIICHLHQSKESYGGSDTLFDVLTSLKELQKIAPVVILSEVDSPNLIVDALENGVRGYILTESTTLELGIEIIRLVRAGGTFAPPSSLFLQRINRKGATPRATSAQQFTPRQMAVLDHLKLGKANKIIAYELAMSESTVKVHIRNIMKKMKATNRTEVACRAQTFAMSEARVVDIEKEVLHHEYDARRP